MLHDQNERNAVANRLIPTYIGHAFNVVTRGLFSVAPRMTMSRLASDHTSAQSFKRFVPVTRAPHPSDLWWENTRSGGKQVIFRRVVSWLIYIALLVISGSVMSSLTTEAIDETGSSVPVCITSRWHVS